MNTDNTSHLNYPERVHLTQQQMDNIRFCQELDDMLYYHKKLLYASKNPTLIVFEGSLKFNDILISSHTFTPYI
jgi:hypothetical protein